MDELVGILTEKGYDLDRGADSKRTKRISPVSAEIEGLCALSKDLASAKLELHQLGSDAEFDDLVSASALEGKIKMLQGVQRRVADILAGKEKMLSFIQKQHSRGGQGNGLPVHASHQESMQDLFRSLFEHLEIMDKCVSSVMWGASPSAAEARLQFDAVLASMTNWQAKYSRALEVSESFTKLLEGR